MAKFRCTEYLEDSKYEDIRHDGFNSLSVGFRNLLASNGVPGANITDPNSLKKISVLVGDHTGYKLVAIEGIMEKALGALDEWHTEHMDNIEKTNSIADKKRKIAKERYNDRKSAPSYDENIRKSIVETLEKVARLGLEKLEDDAYAAESVAEEYEWKIQKRIRNDALETIGNILKEQQVVFQNDKGEVGLLAYHGGRLTSMKAGDVEKEMKSPEDIGFFKKFMLAVKDFFNMEKTEDDLKFMTQQNAYELEKAKRKVLGIKEPAKKAKETAEKKTAEKSGEKAEPKKDEPKKEAPKKTQGKGM